MATNSGPWATCAIINQDKNKNRICWNKNGGHFEFRMVILKPFPIDSAPWKTPYWTFWSSKLGNWCKTYWHNRFFRMASGGHFENRFPELLPLSSISTQVFFTPWGGGVLLTNFNRNLEDLKMHTEPHSAIGLIGAVEVQSEGWR